MALTFSNTSRPPLLPESVTALTACLRQNASLASSSARHSANLARSFGFRRSFQ